MSEFKSMKGLKVPPVGVLPPEKLKEIIRLQGEINKAFLNPLTLNTKEKEQWTLNLIHALTSELEEVKDQINWKWWSKQRKDVDIIELKYEIIDLMHFVLSLALLWGMDENEIYRMFVAKARENLDRQKRNY